MNQRPPCAFAAVLLLACGIAIASSGDPQARTDHPWYPGELACSTFQRLFATQAEVYQRVTGRSVQTDQDKALASWFWRNFNYAHAEDGKCDQFGQGFDKGDWNREYWTGLFAHGFALCGTTHAQWCAEINVLLGHARGRTVGVTGHNSFEVFLTGGEYGQGRWALLDHDISTVIFDPEGKRLLSIQEVMADLKTLRNPAFRPQRQQGWRVAGLHDDDAGTYSSFRSVEYLSGYAGPPPMVHLRSGESMRRYPQPGLEDGRTFVYWGMNYKAAGIPGPERSRTWVNQPGNMHGSTRGSGWKPGQARYANAVYTYAPSFADGSYRQAVIAEDDTQVTFEFYSPYVIAATPPNDKPWGVYDPGGTNGLVIRGKLGFGVQISTDQGATWKDAPAAAGDSLDLTDLVKGHYQYFLRFNAPAAALRQAELSWRTVCQANSAIIPRLRDGANRITFASSGRALIAAGPNRSQAEAHLVAGQPGTSGVTIQLQAPRGEKAVHLYAASWNLSGNPPQPAAYQIEYSDDAGQTWKPVVKDWQITRRPPEPAGFWSQSFCWGDLAIPPTSGPLRIRFSNTGRRGYRKIEAYLVYEIARPSPTEVTFCWQEGDARIRTATRTFAPGRQDDAWQLTTGANTTTLWVEYSAR
jgi:hypothetical protein